MTPREFQVKKHYRRISRVLRRPLHERHAIRQLQKFHFRERTLEETVETAIDMRSRGLLKIKSSQKPSEILALARAVASEKPKVILEIGSARGGTLFIWSQLASLKVIACDLEIPSYRRRLYRHFTRPDSSCEISTLEGDSHDPELRTRVLLELQGRNVDFLFIDGDHTEIGVAADYEAYAPLVRPGGLIALHDIVDLQPYPTNQVQHFWKRLRVREECEEFIDDPAQCGFGIGLVRVAQR